MINEVVLDGWIVYVKKTNIGFYFLLKNKFVAIPVITRLDLPYIAVGERVGIRGRLISGKTIDKRIAISAWEIISGKKKWRQLAKEGKLNTTTK